MLFVRQKDTALILKRHKLIYLVGVMKVYTALAKLMAVFRPASFPSFLDQGSEPELSPQSTVLN
jgi:hypothetical protein